MLRYFSLVLTFLASLKIVKDDFTKLKVGRAPIVIFWVSGLILAKIGGLPPLKLNLALGCAVFVFFWVLYQIDQKLIGGADVLMLGVLASLLSPEHSLIVVFISAVLALGYLAITKKSKAPLVTFLSLAFWILIILFRLRLIPGMIFFVYRF